MQQQEEPEPSAVGGGGRGRAPRACGVRIHGQLTG
jgi:hypothetical protein